LFVTNTALIGTTEEAAEKRINFVISVIWTNEKSMTLHMNFLAKMSLKSTFSAASEVVR
jgi:hypothetical protein